MEFNEKGWDLFNTWSKKYANENDRLGGNSSEGEFVEGWCIIENNNFVKTPEDVVGLYLFGYDTDIFYMIDEWKKNGINGSDCVWDGINLTLDEFEKEIEKYFIH